MTPYRRFSVTLGVALLASTAVTGGAAAWLVQRLFVQETAAATTAAVQVHFQHLFGFDIFRAVAAEAAPSEEGYGDPPPAPPAGAGALGVLDRMVRLHFDLYDVVHAAFYRPDGTIVYSYRLDEVGAVKPEAAATAAPGAKSAFRLLSWGRDGPRVPALRQYLPVYDGAQVVGYAEVYRDVTPLLRDIRRMQAALGLVVLGVFAALFGGLRRIFVASTDALNRQSGALAEAVAQLNAAYDATLHALSAALESRDAETEGHALRVAAYAGRLGHELGLRGPELQALVRGALLHDVGKIGVPDGILCKPGPLTGEEWAVMRRHPLIGAEMLEDVPFLAEALPVVRHHHERYDGTGYPDGLRGEEIPLAARIFAVIDAFDAMCSDRPYRRALPFARAVAELRRGAGSQFDPRVVEAFLAIPREEWQALRTGAAAPGPDGGPFRRRAAAA